MLVFGKVIAVNKNHVFLVGGHSDKGHTINKLTLGKAQMEGMKSIDLPPGMNIADLIGKTISANVVERDYSFKSTNPKDNGKIVSGTSYYIGNILTIK
jgi:hypothetical protein